MWGGEKERGNVFKELDGGWDWKFFNELGSLKIHGYGPRHKWCVFILPVVS